MWSYVTVLVPFSNHFSNPIWSHLNSSPIWSPPYIQFRHRKAPIWSSNNHQTGHHSPNLQFGYLLMSMWSSVLTHLVVPLPIPSPILQFFEWEWSPKFILFTRKVTKIDPWTEMCIKVYSFYGNHQFFDLFDGYDYCVLHNQYRSST